MGKSDRGKTSPRKATGDNAMASTAFPAATEAAVEILKAGGNAVDAAITAAWVLSVCEPSGSGLGGQTTMLITLPGGKIIALDGHSYAPAAVSLRTVGPKQQRRGFRACTIPSTPATLGAVSARYGKLPLKTLIEPAIRLAEEGFPVTKLFRRHLRWCQKALEKDAYAARRFLPKGKPPVRGRTFRQKKLARTLGKLATNGTEDFYRGEIADAIVKDMQRNGGLLNREDLVNFEIPVEREPIEISYRDHRVVSVPPPGGGLQLLAGLKVIDTLDLEFGNNNNSVDWYESLALIINAIFRERVRWPISPDLVTASVRNWLLSEERAKEVANMIRSEENLAPIMIEEEPGETTHLCTVDKDGMAVALTQSVQSLYGAKVTNKDLGFFYNNYLCTCPRYHHPYQLKSHAMPQSNVAPTFVFRGEDSTKTENLRLVIGAAGSRRITSSILQIIINLLDRGKSLPEAVDAPRVHAMLNGKAMVEQEAASKKLTSQLSKYFRHVQIKAAHSHAMGAVQAIGREENGDWVGVADPRREGKASGY
jgi:gamma-glutamyltranspeptidase/glutathione hydrolase